MSARFFFSSAAPRLGSFRTTSDAARRNLRPRVSEASRQQKVRAGSALREDGHQQRRSPSVSAEAIIDSENAAISIFQKRDPKGCEYRFEGSPSELEYPAAQNLRESVYRRPAAPAVTGKHRPPIKTKHVTAVDVSTAVGGGG